MTRVWYEVEARYSDDSEWRPLNPQPRAESLEACQWCKDTSLKARCRIVKVTETREVVE